MPIIQLLLYLVTVVLCNVHGSLEHEIPRRSFLSRRAIDGTRGRKYFDPEEEGTFDSYGSAGGQYDRYKDKQDHSDIRMNVPGEPGVDYPAYTTLPQTGFSCEGRSRGYYADEVAGCQVFHVCHDILVSSFLCPIGSIFSQKLLTCDWWSKVDCSTTRKFVEVNQDDHYQEDDDELIRKAYGMMGLQIGTDVASDELVDPDRGGRIVDYITIDSARRNDLPVYRNNLPRAKTPPNQFFSTYEERASPIYRPNSFHGQNDLARPYQDSPIVRIENIGGENYREREQGRYDYQDNRDKSGKRINEFQPSYAPTVPTVTTTTRRLYSPTIPTTNRPSTLVYNRFDQDIESSDHLYTHSQEPKSFFTLSTISTFNKNSKGKYNDSNLQSYKNYNEDRRDSDHLKEEPSDSYEIVKRIDPADERLEDSFVGDEYIDDIEIKESIGIGRAFNGSNKFRIHVRDPKDNAKDANEDGPSSVDANRNNLTELFDRWQTETTTDTPDYASILEKGSTTPVIEHSSNFQLESINTEIEVPSTTSSYEENLTSTETTTVSLDKKLYSTENPSLSNNDDFKIRTSIDSTISQPDVILKPPAVTETKFRINVPDYPSTQTPVFHSSHHKATYSEVQSSTRIPTDESFLIGETNESTPWFQRTTNFPATDIEPPFVGGFDLKDTVDEIFAQTLKVDTPVQATSMKNIVNGKEDDDTRGRNSRQQEGAKFVDESIEISDGEDRTKIRLDSSTNLRSISSIEDAIERNNSPYQVSVTLNQQNESVPMKDDLIVSLIEQHERNNSRPGRFGQIEIVKSVEGVTETGSSDFPYNDNNKILYSNDTINLSSDRKEVGSIDAGSSNVNSLSLLQLMAELLKIDHIPRPFSLNHFTQGVNPNLESNWNENVLSSTTTIKSVDDSLQREKNVVPRLRDILDGTITPRSVVSKDRALGELTDKFDRPLNNVEHRLAIYQLPQIQRSLDFEESKEFANSSTTSSPKTTNVNESVQTVVETEFVPSIGFSFDTNEGRKKYIDAILGGLLDESIHESNTNKSFNEETIDDRSSSRNESRSSPAQI